MKVLVTGTAGFIGNQLALRLLERGDEVIGLDNLNDYYDVNLKLARLREAGIDTNQIEEGKEIVASNPNYLLSISPALREHQLLTIAVFDYKKVPVLTSLFLH
jgi:UDP-glucuronate 4-epimerase